MKTKLDYYRIFYETARHQSFSKAAKSMYISQSAISQCIHQLESDLDTILFVRTRHGVSLTKEGELLFQKVESAMQSLMQGETLIARMRHMESGSLNIAAGDSITSHYLLPYLEQFHSKYPEIRIELANSYSYQMLELVKSGKAELAFVNMPISDDELITEECLEIHDVFVCSPKLQIKDSYSWSEIANEPLILLEPNSSSRHYINKQFEKKGVDLTPQIEIAAHELLIQFASINLGVSCVIKEFSKESLKEGKVIELNLNPPLPPRSVGCAYLRNTPLSLAAETFLNFIKNDSKEN